MLVGVALFTYPSKSHLCSDVPEDRGEVWPSLLQILSGYFLTTIGQMLYTALAMQTYAFMSSTLLELPSPAPSRRNQIAGRERRKGAEGAQDDGATAISFFDYLRLVPAIGPATGALVGSIVILPTGCTYYALLAAAPIVIALALLAFAFPPIISERDFFPTDDLAIDTDGRFNLSLSPSTTTLTDSDDHWGRRRSGGELGLSRGESKSGDVIVDTRRGRSRNNSYGAGDSLGSMVLQSIEPIVHPGVSPKLSSTGLSTTPLESQPLLTPTTPRRGTSIRSAKNENDSAEKGNENGEKSNPLLSQALPPSIRDSQLISNFSSKSISKPSSSSKYETDSDLEGKVSMSPKAAGYGTTHVNERQHQQQQQYEGSTRAVKSDYGANGGKRDVNRYEKTWLYSW